MPWPRVLRLSMRSPRTMQRPADQRARSRRWYVTAYLEQAMVRGYVEDFRVNTELPEPLAELRQLDGGETAEGLAKEKFHDAVTDGHDLRYYENVLLYVNQGRKGIHG